MQQEGVQEEVQGAGIQEEKVQGIQRLVVGIQEEVQREEVGIQEEVQREEGLLED